MRLHPGRQDEHAPLVRARPSMCWCRLLAHVALAPLIVQEDPPAGDRRRLTRRRGMPDSLGAGTTSDELTRLSVTPSDGASSADRGAAGRPWSFSEAERASPASSVGSSGDRPPPAHGRGLRSPSSDDRPRGRRPRRPRPIAAFAPPELTPSSSGVMGHTRSSYPRTIRSLGLPSVGARRGSRHARDVGRGRRGRVARSPRE